MMNKMMKTILALILVLANVVEAAPINRLPTSIIAIESNAQRIVDDSHLRNTMRRNAREYKKYNLDRVDEFEAELSEGLPANEEAARKIFLNRVSTVGERLIEKAAINAYQGLITAIQYSIDRYPAVIFDRKYVVYGVADIHQAFKVYQRYVLEKEVNH